jgi:hypothetical protein
LAERERLWRTRLDDGPASVRKLDPKNLGVHAELNVIPSRLPFAKSTAKVTPSSMSGVPGKGGKSKRRLRTTPVFG